MSSKVARSQYIVSGILCNRFQQFNLLRRLTSLLFTSFNLLRFGWPKYVDYETDMYEYIKIGFLILKSLRTIGIYMIEVYNLPNDQWKSLIRNFYIFVFERKSFINNSAS